MIRAKINMNSGRGNYEKFSARKRAMNYYSRKPPTTNSRIAHDRIIEFSICDCQHGIVPMFIKWHTGMLLYAQDQLQIANRSSLPSLLQITLLTPSVTHVFVLLHGSVGCIAVLMIFWDLEKNYKDRSKR